MTNRFNNKCPHWEFFECNINWLLIYNWEKYCQHVNSEKYQNLKGNSCHFIPILFWEWSTHWKKLGETFIIRETTSFISSRSSKDGLVHIKHWFAFVTNM